MADDETNPELESQVPTQEEVAQSKRTVKINVLKPFRLSRKPTRDGQLPTEQEFGVGEHEIDEETAAHPWMAAPNFADGHIESPQAMHARLKAQAERNAFVRDNADKANRDAQAAMDRLVRSHNMNQEDKDKTYEDLNTPLNVLKAKSGDGLGELPPTGENTQTETVGTNRPSKQSPKLKQGK